MSSNEEVFCVSNYYEVINALAVTPDEKFVICGLEDGTIHLFNLEKKQFDCILKYHSDSIIDIAMSSSGRFFVSGSEDSTIKA